MKAFPLKAVNQFDDSEGMDLRDYFAAKAMHSFILGAFMENRDIEYKDMAEGAYSMADEMMKEREKP